MRGERIMHFEFHVTARPGVIPAVFALYGDVEAVVQQERAFEFVAAGQRYRRSGRRAGRIEEPNFEIGWIVFACDVREVAGWRMATGAVSFKVGFPRLDRARGKSRRRNIVRIRTKARMEIE